MCQYIDCEEIMTRRPTLKYMYVEPISVGSRDLCETFPRPRYLLKF